MNTCSPFLQSEGCVMLSFLWYYFFSSSVVGCRQWSLNTPEISALRYMLCTSKSDFLEAELLLLGLQGPWWCPRSSVWDAYRHRHFEVGAHSSSAAWLGWHHTAVNSARLPAPLHCKWTWADCRWRPPDGLHTKPTVKMEPSFCSLSTDGDMWVHKGMVSVLWEQMTGWAGLVQMPGTQKSQLLDVSPILEYANIHKNISQGGDQKLNTGLTYAS